MSPPPVVSIIIPHFNRAEIIKQTLQSVFDQTYTNWEVIIVDDNSEVDQFYSLKETVKHPQVSIFQRHGSVKGPSACRNQGAQVAKGNYVIFLDSDDLLAPHCLANRVAAMAEYPELSFGVFLMQEFEFLAGDRSNIYNLNLFQKEELLSSFLENHNPWNVTCPIWNRESFLALGSFDVDLFYMEDPELHVRALLAGNITFKTFYDQPADSFYRINYHDAAKAGFYENSIKYRILFYKKVWSYIRSTDNAKAVSDKYKSNIKVGLMNTLKHFLLSRIAQFATYYEEMYLWAKEQEILTPRELFNLRLLKYIWVHDHKLFKILRLKGLSRKLLLN